MGRTRAKVTIVGAGNVGHSAAQWMLSHRLADVVLVDVIEGMPQGKALDLLEAAPIEGVDFRFTGTNGYDETEHSDIVVIVAGIVTRTTPFTRRAWTVLRRRGLRITSTFTGRRVPAAAYELVDSSPGRRPTRPHPSIW